MLFWRRCVSFGGWLCVVWVLDVVVVGVGASVFRERPPISQNSVHVSGMEPFYAPALSLQPRAELTLSEIQETFELLHRYVLEANPDAEERDLALASLGRLLRNTRRVAPLIARPTDMFLTDIVGGLERYVGRNLFHLRSQLPTRVHRAEVAQTVPLRSSSWPSWPPRALSDRPTIVWIGVRSMVGTNMVFPPPCDTIVLLGEQYWEDQEEMAGSGGVEEGCERVFLDFAAANLPRLRREARGEPVRALVLLSMMQLPGMAVVEDNGRRWEDRDVDVYFLGDFTGRRGQVMRQIVAETGVRVGKRDATNGEDAHAILGRTKILVNIRKELEPNTNALPQTMELHRISDAGLRAGVVLSEPGDPATVNLLRDAGAVHFAHAHQMAREIKRLLFQPGVGAKAMQNAQRGWQKLLTVAPHSWRCIATYGSILPCARENNTRIR